jgi:hypothetical protein
MPSPQASPPKIEDVPLETLPDHAKGDVRESVKDHEKPDQQGGYPHMISLDTRDAHAPHLPLPAHSHSYVDDASKNEEEEEIEEEAEDEAEAEAEVLSHADVTHTCDVSHIPLELLQWYICHTTHYFIVNNSHLKLLKCG